MQLLGDLLFHISGVTGKMTTETASEDDNFGTAASNKVRTHLLYFIYSAELNILLLIKSLSCVYYIDLPCPRLSLVLWVLRGVTASSLASTWAVQTPSWWFVRPRSMCGRSWCQTPPELFERSFQLSSLSCLVSWLPPGPTRERYSSPKLPNSLSFCSHTGEVPSQACCTATHMNTMSYLPCKQETWFLSGYGIREI